MKERKTIEISFPVYQAIEAAKEGFDDTDDAALRRLLRLRQENAQADVEKRGATGGGWSRKGVYLQEGTELMLTYKGVSKRGRVEPDALCFDDKRYRAPSPAVMDAVSEATGEESPSINGWLHVSANVDGAWNTLKALQKVHGENRDPAG